jgi:hypothetical protein
MSTDELGMLPTTAEFKYRSVRTSWPQTKDCISASQKRHPEGLFSADDAHQGLTPVLLSPSVMLCWDEQQS